MSQNQRMTERNQKKALAVILYLAHRIPDPTYHSIGKLLYFADKTSLERYGRQICDSTYFAMEHGPVPSEVYDLMKEAPASGEFGFTVGNERDIIPLREADTDELSDSDIECLDDMIALYGTVPFWKKSQDSHDDAWQQAWQSRGKSASNRMPLESIVALLEDADELWAHLQNQNDE